MSEMSNDEIEAENYGKIFKEAVETEVKRLNELSPSELIQYAAETRLNLTGLYGFLTAAVTDIQKMQQRQLLVIDTINDMIAQKTVKPIEDKDLTELKKVISFIRSAKVN